VDGTDMRFSDRIEAGPFAGESNQKPGERNALRGFGGSFREEGCGSGLRGYLPP